MADFSEYMDKAITREEYLASRDEEAKAGRRSTRPGLHKTNRPQDK